VRPTAIVRYRYRRSGSSGPWTSSTWSGQVLQPLETLEHHPSVMKRLAR